MGWMPVGLQRNGMWSLPRGVARPPPAPPCSWKKAMGTRRTPSVTSTASAVCAKTAASTAATPAAGNAPASRLGMKVRSAEA